MTHQYFQMATLQTMKLKEIKDSWNDNAIDLTEVDYLLITWKNDPFKGRGKVPFLSKVETIDLDDLECDNVNSLEETTVTLDRCIQMFSESEILEKSEYWYCSTCKVCLYGGGGNIRVDKGVKWSKNVTRKVHSGVQDRLMESRVT